MAWAQYFLQLLLGGLVKSKERRKEYLCVADGKGYSKSRRAMGFKLEEGKRSARSAIGSAIESNTEFVI